ncbi:hypothetical protein PUR57_29975 [Streptomyces sp. JV176]|nr:hypothetical protein [Streptomyces sp. JV176]MEE1802860.1 hypothetical protein [Streptomyces sp. JV176]
MDCWYCEACWKNSVEAVRTTPDGTRDLLCLECAQGNYPRRVDLFPPLGIYGLMPRRVRVKVPARDSGHGHPGRPPLSPHPGPHAPPHPHRQSPPGTPPV